MNKIQKAIEISQLDYTDGSKTFRTEQLLIKEDMMNDLIITIYRDGQDSNGGIIITSNNLTSTIYSKHDKKNAEIRLWTQRPPLECHMIETIFDLDKFDITDMKHICDHEFVYDYKHLKIADGRDYYEFHIKGVK